MFLSSSINIFSKFLATTSAKFTLTTPSLLPTQSLMQTCQQTRQMSKLKTHTGAAKRWKRVANGLYKRKQAGKQHLNSKMSPSRRRSLGKTVLSNSVQTRVLNRLLPY
ncbi:50S ribosomal protein L35 [Smittium culicis]|uniref:50S ribosomal protein L35 n=1 Tax=Smittium culicis TaxID=133412 RepID=A0A1R1YQF2_9FUNG|nr:50S ribosomal protein L35 [Smittium culicis]